jgi:branched-chain amino acid transport system permease protein
MAPSDPIRWPIIAVLFGGAIVGALVAGDYWLTVVTEIAILAIFALSVDFLVGYSGLVTFGHAGFMGVGAYATAYLSQFLGWPLGLAIPAAVAVGVIAGLVVGWLVTRVAGVFFIMVTLAFSMMFWAWAAKARLFNGDDGLGGLKRLDLRAIGIDLESPRIFALFCLAVAFATYLLFLQLARSPFGQTMKAIKQNENRIRAQGCPVQAYKAAAFTVAAAVAALAGALHVQNTKFVHPEVAHWIRSGEGLIVVIIGGAGTLVGPLIGTYLFVLFHKIVEQVTQHWQVWMGLCFIAIVLAAPDGIYGRLLRLAQGRGRSPPRRD